MGTSRLPRKSDKNPGAPHVHVIVSHTHFAKVLGGGGGGGERSSVALCFGRQVLNLPLPSFRKFGKYIIESLRQNLHVPVKISS